MRLVAAFAVAFAIPVLAQAETIVAPHPVPNDTWVYQLTREDKAGWRQTRDELSVARVTSTGIFVNSKQVGSTMPPRETVSAPDWSRVRSVNGKETLVNQPMSFPLSVGKAWTVEYSEDNPNRAHKNEHFKTTFKVTGWEDVTVPAGTFHALKIEGDGNWTATMAPAVNGAAATRVDAAGTTAVVQTQRQTATTSSGRLYKGFWYVPSIKRWVKSEEDYYDSNGVRNEHFVGELVSFTPGS